MIPALTRELADVLRAEQPDLCRTLEHAYRQGVPTADLQECVNRAAAVVGGAPVAENLVNAFLRDLDPEFAREECRREDVAL